MVGVTVPIGLALLTISTALVVLYCKGYISSPDKHQQQGREMTDLAEVVAERHTDRSVPPFSSTDPGCANLPPPTSTTDYEVLSRKPDDDGEYEKLQ